MGRAPGKAPSAWATTSSPDFRPGGPETGQQVPWNRWSPARRGPVGHWGRQSPIVLSAAHRLIQEPRVKCTAGSRCDSALTRSGSPAEPRRRRGAGRWGGGWPRLGWARVGRDTAPAAAVTVHTKRNHNSLPDPSANQTSTGSSVGAERAWVRSGWRPRGAGERVSYPLPNSQSLSAPIGSELTGSIAFSRGKEPVQYRGLYSSTLAHRALGNVRE